MKLLLLLSLVALVLVAGCTQKPPQLIVYESDYYVEDTQIKWLGHASFKIKNSGNTIYLDPFVLENEPDIADYVFISHAHSDHCNNETLQKIAFRETKIVTVLDCLYNITAVRTNSIRPGTVEFFDYIDVKIQFMDAYNEFHEKGKSGGMMVTFNKSGALIKIYHTGDTVLIPEFENLTKEKIDVLLLPIGGKYTMDEEQAAEATKIIKPKVVIPMHYNSEAYGIDDVGADPEKFRELLKGSGIEVVILKPAVNKGFE